MRSFLFAIAILFSFQLHAEFFQGVSCPLLLPVIPDIEATNLEMVATFVEKTRFKDWGELSKYYDCFKAKNTKFSEKDKQAMILAAKHYKLPPALLYCMLFIESRFVEKDVSRVGAQGIAQFMPDTFKGMRGRHRRPEQKNLDRCAKSLEEGKLEGRQKINCDSWWDRQHDAEVWEALNADFKANGLVKDKIVYEVTNRVSGIAIGAFYINELINQVAEYYQIDRSNMETLNIEVLKLAFAGYNGGPGRLAGNLKRNGRSIKSAMTAARRIAETRSHMDGIEGCMSTGSGLAPSKYERDKGIKCKTIEP